jgi:hypothetical protein
MKDKEYYWKVKEIIKDSLDELFEVKTLEEKMTISLEIRKNLDELFEPIVKSAEKITFKHDAEVIKKIRRITQQDIDIVSKFAEDNNYPEMEIGNNKRLGRGKESWDNAMTWSSLEEPYRSNFLDVVTAVEKYGSLHKTG